MKENFIVYLAFLLIIYAYQKKYKLHIVITTILYVLLAGYVFLMESSLLNNVIKQILNSISVIVIAIILLRRLYIRKKDEHVKK